MSLGGKTRITWLGHSTFRFDLPSGEVVILDPWLEGNPACPGAMKTPERADALLVTHAHGDHLGETVALAKKHTSKVVCIYDLAVYLGAQGVAEDQLIGMNKGGTVTPLAGFSATQVGADHSSCIQTADGQQLYGGEPVGYVLRIQGMPSIYAAGDTGLFGGLPLFGDYYKPDVAILPIGGHFTLDPPAAAYAARLLKVKTVVPCHYGTFPILKGTPDELREALGSGIEVVAVKPGETLP